MVAEIDLRLASEPEVVTTARHALDRLADLLPPEKLEDVRLVVCDPGSGFEAPSEPRPRPGLKRGWGLPIVERISDRWGVERNSYACVWFEID